MFVIVLFWNLIRNNVLYLIIFYYILTLWDIFCLVLCDQEGRYGKINKCITFPEMLDMIPFMTGTGDIPPLYALYAVVVHLDTLNASFSGHYVSYVKDLQGNWFRIDDTEVTLFLCLWTFLCNQSAYAQLSWINISKILSCWDKLHEQLFIQQ
jgi:hypothetical protein